MASIEGGIFPRPILEGPTLPPVRVMKVPVDERSQRFRIKSERVTKDLNGRYRK